MTDITNIPLRKLIAWEGNVRKTGIAEGLDELAASIAAHGLLQSLIVRKAPRGKFAVVAGGRRLMALERLVKDRTIEADFEVPCRVIPGEAAATEISLAENVVRVPMHPTDQFEAFRRVIDDGASVTDVAARFGVSERLVLKRLKLGRLSPVILSAYREGQIGLDEAQAFAISDDHNAQERVWSELAEWNRDARSIRRALTDEEIPATDKRVRFLGLDAYEEAGGPVRRDLFDDENGGYVQDAQLLDRLVTAKLETLADGLRAEGWKWTQVHIDCGYDDLSGYDQLHPVRVALSDEDAAELDRLSAEYDELAEDHDPEDAQASERLMAIEEAMDAINAASRVYTPDMLARAGVIVSLDYHGEVDIHRGLVRPEDAAPEEASPDADPDAADGLQPGTMSARLIEDLTAQKTCMLRVELARQPAIAIAALVHALALEALYRGAGSHSSLDVRLTDASLEKSLYDAEGSKALAAFEAEKRRRGDRLPDEPEALWSWCLNAAHEDLLDLLAVCTASCLDVTRRKADGPRSGRIAHGDALGRALRVDLADWYVPTASGFFARVSRAATLTALAQARGKPCAPSWAKLKKAELATLAEREITGTGWYPEPLRVADEASAIELDDGTTLAAE